MAYLEVPLNLGLVGQEVTEGHPAVGPIEIAADANEAADRIAPIAGSEASRSRNVHHWQALEIVGNRIGGEAIRITAGTGAVAKAAQELPDPGSQQGMRIVLRVKGFEALEIADTENVEHVEGRPAVLGREDIGQSDSMDEAKLVHHILGAATEIEDYEI